MPIQRFYPHIPQRYRLEGTKCKKCGKVHFPPRQVCNSCGSKELEPYRLAEEGEIITYTVVYTPPDDFKTKKPYVVAIAKMDDGAKLTAQVTDCTPDEVEIGKRVRVVFRKINAEGKSGIIEYGYKFVLI